MKNAENIKAEAKEQIMKLLDFVGCYAYEEKFIDAWLDTWEKAKSPMIEAIAEKSPYYDGKCKIVFPSEYPREVNPSAIDSFCEWLECWGDRNVPEVKVNGYTYNDHYAIRKWLKYLRESNRYLPESVPDNFQSLFNVIISCKDDIFITYDNITDILNDIESTSWYAHGKYYDADEWNKSGANYAIKLASILSCSYARGQFLDDTLVSYLTTYFGAKCKFTVGQKLSRAVNMIATKYGLNKDPEWNKAFAKYADAINPLTIIRWTVISWHPMDYLTFCFGNSWSTCSNIDKHNKRNVKIGSSHSSITSYVDENYVFRGEHSAAALSYMFDKASFIYYTVNHKYNDSHYEEQDKETRIVFSMNETYDTLLESRLYPQCNDDNPNDSNYRIPREIVQKCIADSLDIPNLWKMKKGYSFCSDYAHSIGVHYPDYSDSRNKECNISWCGDEPHRFYIGHDAICPKCGRSHTYTASLNCRDCDPEYDD